MTEFGSWDRVRHTYKTHIGTVVREGNITTISDVGISYVTNTSSGTFFAQPENLELISKRTRKKVKPSKKEKELRAKLREIEAYIKPIANDSVSIYSDDWYERGFERGQINLAREVLLVITEGKR